MRFNYKRSVWWWWDGCQVASFRTCSCGWVLDRELGRDIYQVAGFNEEWVNFRKIGDLPKNGCLNFVRLQKWRSVISVSWAFKIDAASSQFRRLPKLASSWHSQQLTFFTPETKKIGYFCWISIASAIFHCHREKIKKNFEGQSTDANVDKRELKLKFSQFISIPRKLWISS